MVIVSSNPRILSIIMPYARLLNQINKVRETELQIYTISFVVSAQPLLNTTFPFAQGESLPNWLRGNFCCGVCFDLLVGRISFLCSH